MEQAAIETKGVVEAGVVESGFGHSRTAVDDGSALCFGGFRVHPGARTVTLDQHEVPLGSRAFNLLVVLLRSRGKIVTKEEIVREVWPSTFVDESNLRFQMGVLRKALGPERDRIKTIPGRGYLLAGDDDEHLSSGRQPEPAGSPGPSARGAQHESVILIVESNADDRHAMATLLRMLKVRVISFTSVDEVAAFAVSPLSLASS